jgi:hypothetical protein
VLFPFLPHAFHIQQFQEDIFRSTDLAFFSQRAKELKSSLEHFVFVLKSFLPLQSKTFFCSRNDFLERQCQN